MPSSEAEKVIKDFFDHAMKCRLKGINDFGEILFRYAMTAERSGSNGGFSKKFVRMARDFVATDPRYQRRLA